MIFLTERKKLFLTNKIFFYLIFIPNIIIPFQSNVQRYRSKGHEQVCVLLKNIGPIFFVTFLIWTRPNLNTNKDKWCIKMMGYPWEINWNHHHQHFLFKIYRKQWKWHGCTWNLFWFLAQPTTEHYGSFASQSVCWHSLVWM